MNRLPVTMVTGFLFRTQEDGFLISAFISM